MALLRQLGEQRLHLLALKTLDQSSLDQHAIEAAGLGAVGTAIEQRHAAPENFFLLGKCGIERNTGRFLNHQRQIGAFQGVERRAHVHRRKVYCVYRIISGEIAWIVMHDPFDYLSSARAWIENLDRKRRLVIAEPHHQECVVRKIAAEPVEEFGIVMGAHGLPANIFVHFERIAERPPIGRQIRAERPIPRKMIDRHIRKDEERRSAAFTCNRGQHVAEEEFVRLDIA